VKAYQKITKGLLAALRKSELSWPHVYKPNFITFAVLSGRHSLHSMDHLPQPPALIKLLAIDIDGTLLDPAGDITPRTLATVRAAQEAGIAVTLATARRYSSTARIAEQLGLAGALIVYDGAMIVQYPQNTILATCALAADIAQQAVDVLVNHGVQPIVHPHLGLNEEIWTGPPDFENYWLEAYYMASPGQVRRMPFASLCAGRPDPLRVVAFDSEEAIQRTVPDVAKLPASWTTIRRGNYGCAELAIMNRECSKASGLATVAKLLRIPPQEVMAIGDNNNDIAMLGMAGWSVAMGHAPAAVKAAANAITASNAEDGAAQAIERYALRRDLSACSNSLNRST
jgi:Cof subfamily protein (haloacid dehalogenase superfamily)